MTSLFYARKVDDAWRPFVQNEVFIKLVTTAVVSRLDGSTEEIEVPPYPIEIQLAPTAALALWSDEELAETGIARVVSFVPPAGKRITGPRELVEFNGNVREAFEVEDLPPGMPGPALEERLAAAGFSLEELRAALGLGV